MIEMLKNLEDLCKTVQKEIREFEFYKSDNSNIISTLKSQKDTLLSQISGLKEDLASIVEKVREEKSSVLAEIDAQHRKVQTMMMAAEDERLKIKVQWSEIERAKDRLALTEQEFAKKMAEIEMVKADLAEKRRKHEELLDTLR